MKIFFRALLLLVILFSIGCDDEPKKTNVSISVETNHNDTIIVEEVTEPEKTKTDAELIEEAAIKTLEISSVFFRKMKTNDSIKMANREKMFAYQIGFAISDKDEVFDLFNKLEDTKDIYVLKQSRKDYFIIKYEGKGEKELKDSLLLFEKQIGQDAKVVNLMTLCSKNEKLMVGEKLTKRKDDTEIPCLVCDR